MRYMLISTDDANRDIETEIIDSLPEARKRLLEEFEQALDEELWSELLVEAGGREKLLGKDTFNGSECCMEYGLGPMSAWVNHSRYASHPDVDWKIVEIADAKQAEPVSVAVEVVGGMVQNVYADGPASVEVYDFDTDDPEEAERLEAAREELHRIACDPGWHRAY